MLLILFLLNFHLRLVFSSSSASAVRSTHNSPARDAPPGLVPNEGSSKYVTAGIPRRQESPFFRSIARAREKISQSVKYINRPRLPKTMKPSVSQMMQTEINRRSSSGILRQTIFSGSVKLPSPNSVLPQHSVDAQQSAPKTVPADRLKPQEACWLARWNRELAFSEVPNLIMEKLAWSTTRTKSSDTDKWLSAVLSNLSKVQDHEKFIHSGTFVIPPGTDISSCSFSVSGEEPIQVSLRHIRSVYTLNSVHPQFLDDLVEASRSCFPAADESVKQCLSFGLQPADVLGLPRPDTVFGNDEICRKNLSPSILGCVKSRSDLRCTVDHLLSLVMFARNFFLCSESVPRETAALIQDEAFMRDFEQTFGSSSPPFYPGMYLLATAVLVALRA